MERGEIMAFTERCQHLFIEQNGVREIGTAVHDTVADRLNLIHAVNTAVFAVQQFFHHQFHGIGMGLHGVIFFHPQAFYQLFVVDKGAVPVADLLADTLGKDLPGSGVQQLIFERAGARVDNQNIHKKPPEEFHSTPIIT